MAEYIEREALMQDISETVIFTVRSGTQLPNAEMRGANKVKDRIMSAPAADVAEVRHGEWKKIELLGCEPMYECSICEKLHDQDYNYCNNCGAKMDGKGEGDV